MASDWGQPHTLNDVTDVIISNVDKKTKPGERPVRLCNYTDVYNNQYIRPNIDFMNATATDHEIEKCSLFKSDVVITKDSEKNDDIGVPAYISDDIDNLVCGYHLVILRPNPDRIDGAYLFYALSTYESQHQFHARANGITRFGLRKADIGTVEIPTPPLPEQRAIANILGTFDDKIELLKKQNKTLEEIARAIFKHWFVDFEFPYDFENQKPDLNGKPYKSSGGKMINSELGKIPINWNIINFLDKFILLSGGTPKTSINSYWDGDIKWISAKDITSNNMQFILNTEKTITSEGIKNSAAKIIPQYTTIISSRGTVGNLCLLSEKMCISQSNYGIHLKEGNHPFFTFLLVLNNIKRLKSQSYGSVFDTITTYTFQRFKIIFPQNSFIEAFAAGWRRIE